MARLRKIFGIAFGVLIQLVASVGSSYGVCRAGQVLHELKNSEGLYEERCCVLGICRPGSQPVICDRDGGSAGCLKCDNGQYQDSEVFTNSSKTCYPHTPCSYEKGLKLLTPGNSTSDNVCICDLSRGLQPTNKGLINQKSCSCLSGFKWDDELFLCKEDPGSYKPISNISLVTNSGLELPTPRDGQMITSEGHNISVFGIFCVSVIFILVIVIIVSVLFCRRQRSLQGIRSRSQRLNNENSSGTNSEVSSLVVTNVEKNDCTTKDVQCTDQDNADHDTKRLKLIDERDSDAESLNRDNADEEFADEPKPVIVTENRVQSSPQHMDRPNSSEFQQSADRCSTNTTLPVALGGTPAIIMNGNGNQLTLHITNQSPCL